MIHLKQPNKPKRKKGFILAILLLALLCVGTAELIACYHFAPATYHRITAPVYAAADSISNTVKTTAEHTVNEISAWLSSLRELREARKLAAEAQAATEPNLKNDSPILDPAITELVTFDNISILTGGTIPVVYYNQGDDTWAGQPYGSDNIGKYGCGPTAMAMAVYSFTGEPIDPAQMAKSAVSSGYWAKKSGSYLSIVNGLAKEYGLVAKSLEAKTPEAMEEALISGKLLIALMGPGHFTKGGHFIVIRGVTLNGTLLVADPNSEERSLQEWDPQLILDELSSSTAHGAPLWTLEYIPS